ncbi:unnamed protein product [Angiostrongylus costaricensis]|uniref:Phosphoribosyltransferase domain-containing protein n=1 Tax=Angiostrongylus costaricensis TaxID=334426 RepID=A0A0R3PJK5_ANGCS|nr:unnamed protein product [Angiostrongylus costaricensis]
MRLVIEEALNKLPYTEVTITTPTHCQYKGIRFMRGNCGVSLCRSGEAMEFALRQCCRSIRICKMLIGKWRFNVIENVTFTILFLLNPLIIDHCERYSGISICFFSLTGNAHWVTSIE